MSHFPCSDLLSEILEKCAIFPDDIVTLRNIIHIFVHYG